MENKSLTFIPSGGLANRMRAMASALNLYRHTGRRIEVVWLRDWGLNAKFYDIFMPITIEGFSIREARFLDILTIDRPRQKNLFLPTLYQRLFYGGCIYEKTVTPRKEKHFDFDKWALSNDKKLYMSCYQVFGEFEDYNAIIRTLFVPITTVQEKINKYVSLFSEHTIGMHIRRTDNAESIKSSPTEKFFQLADSEITTNDSTKIYLATDDEPTKDVFRERYGDRVITPPEPASRGSLEGIKDGIVDMWTLAATNVIYGSKGSSFSPMAASIGGNKLFIVE